MEKQVILLNGPSSSGKSSLAQLLQGLILTRRSERYEIISIDDFLTMSAQDSFCDECPDFPCADVMEKETRYGSQYPLRESPLENLRFLRETGMAAFLEHERKQWTCSACGDVICVHTGVCSGCGRQYTGSMEP